MNTWIKDFSNEMEKLALPFMSTMMNTLMVGQSLQSIKKAQQTNKLESLKQNEANFQLPSTDNFQFNPGKKIDSYLTTGQQRF